MKRLICLLPILLLIVLVGCKEDEIYPYASFPSSSIEVDSETTEHALKISSAYVTWTLSKVSDDASWVKITGDPTRDSSATIFLELEKNLDTLDRVANFELTYLKDSTITKKMEFTQLGQGKVIKLAADTLYFSSSAQTAETAVSSNVAWSAISSQPWLTLSGGTAVKAISDEPLTMTFTENSGYNFRTALVTVAQYGMDLSSSFIAYQRGIGSRSTDSLMLVDLYNNMGGTDWTKGWDLSKPMTAWDGVALDFRDGEQRVVTLDLSENNLSGNIDKGVTNLSYLESLSLYGNNIDGEIPAEIGDLHCLKLLYLQDNNLTGGFPEPIAQCAYLTTIHVGGNQLSGSLPESLADLSNLKILGAANNNFTGTLPVALGSSSTLEVIYVEGNRLSGEIPSTYIKNKLWRTWNYPAHICPQQSGFGFTNCQ